MLCSKGPVQNLYDVIHRNTNSSTLNTAMGQNVLTEYRTTPDEVVSREANKSASHSQLVSAARTAHGNNALPYITTQISSEQCTSHIKI